MSELVKVLDESNAFVKSGDQKTIINKDKNFDDTINTSNSTLRNYKLHNKRQSQSSVSHTHRTF